MQLRLQGVRIAVLGGDERQSLLCSQLAAMGAAVRVIGLRNVENHPLIATYSVLEEAVQGVQIILLPMPGVNDEGRIFAPQINVPLHFTSELAGKLSKNTCILVGVAKPYLRRVLQQERLKFVELGELDRLAILNSIPSAEGAIQMAMQAVPITIHNSYSLVLGFGRTAVTLARMLKGIGARVAVAARKEAALARVEEQGYEPLPLSCLADYIGKADLIFNTIPAPILDKQILTRVSKEAYILDLASTPGGTDFVAAAQLGIKAELAPGLPGKVAPKTAAKILIQVIPDIICELLALE
ncbi:MAG TPA: dipicolinate synthase subunit DpsA [Bacillota bacterium]|nr:dipicolinate synthase subunit DpsA [Bacillota bacterium]